MAGVVVGREAELARLSTLLDGAARGDGLQVGVVTGEPGSGKSTLLRAIADRAAAAGFAVLSSAPRDSEHELAFSALTDLFDVPTVAPFLADDVLPEPQRRALRAALLLDDLAADGADTAVEQRAVAAGVQGVLRACSTERPVLLVVDDAQWLDTATALSLTHATRRLTDAPISLLVGSRPTASPVDWPDGRDHDRVDLELSGLDEAAVFHLVRDRLGVALSRSALHAVVKTSGGNPLYALELARALTTSESSASVWEGTLSQPLVALVGADVRRLPATSRQVLLAAALAAEPTPEVLGRATGLAAATLGAGIDTAAAAEIAWLSGGRVRFRHPLFAAAVVSEAGAEERSSMHRALAEHDPGPVARARHLAHAIDQPDPTVAQDVLDAARHARARGASDVSRELAAAALRVTPPDSALESSIRLMTAGWALNDGDIQTASRLLAPVTERGPQEAALAHVLLARVAMVAGSQDELERHAELAQLHGRDDPIVRAEALLLLADSFVDLDAALRQVRDARQLLDASGAPPDHLVTACLHVEGSVLLLRGDLRGMELLEEATGRERDMPPASAVQSATFALAQQLLFASRLDDARPLLRSLLDRAKAAGDETSVVPLMLNLGHLEIRAGRLDDAEDYARAALAIADVAQMSGPRVLAAAQVTEHDVRRGADPSEVRAALSGLAAEAQQLGDPFLAAIVALITGRACQQDGDDAGAVAAFRRAHQLALDMSMSDLGWNPYPGGLAEALLATGDVDAARVELARLEESPAGLPRPHVVAVVHRIRAELLATDGALDAAMTEIDEALRRFDELGSPVEAARTRLVSGRLLRRAKQKRRAHDALAMVADELERLGCPVDAAQARAELARVGLRPSAPHTLTDTEARVADLAAAGRTNREIAAAMFVSPKTVEGILGRVYRKLGVRSRVELARRRDGQ